MHNTVYLCTLPSRHTWCLSSTQPALPNSFYVLRHFTETASQKTSTQHADRLNTSLCFFQLLQKFQELGKWQSRRCHLMVLRAISFSHQQKKPFLSITDESCVYLMTILYVALQLPRSSYEMNFGNPSTAITAIQISIQPYSNCWEGYLVLIQWFAFELVTYRWIIILLSYPMLCFIFNGYSLVHSFSWFLFSHKKYTLNLKIPSFLLANKYSWFPFPSLIYFP